MLSNLEMIQAHFVDRLSLSSLSFKVFSIVTHFELMAYSLLKYPLSNQPHPLLLQILLYVPFIFKLGLPWVYIVVLSLGVQQKRRAIVVKKCLLTKKKKEKKKKKFLSGRIYIYRVILLIDPRKRNEKKNLYIVSRGM